MAKKNKSKLVNHFRRIIDTYPVQLNQMETGDIVRFKYSGSNIFDPNPLIIYIWNDNTTRLIHAINLNYLYEDQVQKLFKRIHKVNPVTGPHVDPDSWTKINLINANRGLFSAKRLYESVIAPQLSPNTPNCYRTYHRDKITKINLVKYKLDFK